MKSYVGIACPYWYSNTMLFDGRDVGAAIIGLDVELNDGMGREPCFAVAGGGLREGDIVGNLARRSFTCSSVFWSDLGSSRMMFVG